MPTFDDEFKEIDHCGGKFIVTAKTDDNGQRGVSFGVTGSSPRPAAIFGIYSLYQGIPVGNLPLAGMGVAMEPPPYENCLPVLIGSDSHGLFGHLCPRCKKYWRSPGAPARWNMTCPYCGSRGPTYAFRTQGQKQYIFAACQKFLEALYSNEDGEWTIDFDQIADAVGTETPKPEFYYSEKSQQNKFTCAACGAINDVLGRFAYCSICGTHNALQELRQEVSRIKEKNQTDDQHSSCVPDLVAAFDSFARQLARQLAARVPMRPARKQRLAKLLFHNLKQRADDLRAWFDIDIFSGLTPEDSGFAVRMFHRRHVYEHNGGEVDQRYIDESGDTLVQLKQTIRETAESVSRFGDLIIELAKNFHAAFGEIFPPEPKPIEYEVDRQRRLASERNRGR